MAVDPKASSMRGISRTLLKEGSYKAFFRGLGPSLLGQLELCLLLSVCSTISMHVFNEMEMFARDKPMLQDQYRGLPVQKSAMILT